MTAPAGSIVRIYIDSRRKVAHGDVITTTSGRRYQVVGCRIQERGVRVGRQHLQCLVLGKDEAPGAVTDEHGNTVQPQQIYLTWYRRKKR